MRKLLLILFLLFVVTGIVTGQDERTPSIPAIEKLFADDVDVLAVEEIEIQSRSYLDNESRIVHIYDEANDEWQEYAYPEDNDANYHLTQRSDDIFLLYSNYPPTNWIINATESTITSLEPVCEDKTPALSGEGKWHYVAEGEAERAYLCFTETDERIPLPEEINDFDAWYVQVPNISPDGNWLVVMNLVSEHLDDYDYDLYSYDLYSFEITHGQLNYLGRIPYNSWAIGDPVISPNWVSALNGFISYGASQESISKDYYRFNVTQADSLELITNGWMYNFRSNPSRYDYVVTRGFLRWKTGSFIQPEYSACSFLRYDANGVQKHELGYDCIGAHVVVGSDHLTALRVDSETAKSSTLIRYDLASREFTEIVSGEIEWFFAGTYPYILLLMDDNGEINLIDYYPIYGFMGDYWFLDNVEGAYLAVYDTKTGEFVYDSSSTHRVSSDSTVFSEWLSEDRFVYSLARREQILTLVVLGEDGAHEYIVEGVTPDINMLELSPDGYRMVVYIPEENTVGVADFLSGEVYPLLNSGVIANNALSFEWIDDNMLNVTVSQQNYAGSTSAVYTVQIP